MKGRKHCENRRNCLLQAISPFLNVFHSYISLVCQNVSLCGNGLIKHRRKILSFSLNLNILQSETEISELKITIQRQDSQLKQLNSTLDTHHSDFTSINIAKEELMKENQRLLTKLQSTEEREKRKVNIFIPSPNSKILLLSNLTLSHTIFYTGPK